MDASTEVLEGGAGPSWPPLLRPMTGQRAYVPRGTRELSVRLPLDS